MYHLKNTLSIALIIILGGLLLAKTTELSFSDFSFDNGETLNAVANTSTSKVSTPEAESKNPEEARPASVTSFYPAHLQHGYIGAHAAKPVDNPFDNVFHIVLDAPPAATDRVWLEYELYGVQDHHSVCRSINDQVSVGGHLVKINREWTKQKERINPEWLSQNDNTIIFTLPKGADYQYEVRNVGLWVEKSASGKALETIPMWIEVPQTPIQKNVKTYLKGFVKSNKEVVAVWVNEEAARWSNGVFEALFTAPSFGEIWVKAQCRDGEIIRQKIALSETIPADFYFPLEKENAHAEWLVTPDLGQTFRLSDASLSVPAGALNKTTTLSITALREVDIPPLDQGMVNVTKGHPAYRFLPHGSQFKKDLSLRLGYDSEKIPEGYTEKDIKTYYFDDQTHHWVALRRDTIDGHHIISHTNHFTDMINGIIKVPESPETQAFNPTSIKDIKAANPSAAINMIQPPTAGSMGNASMSFPINIPAGRQGIQPSIALQYNNEGGNGWLGLGWSLQIPALTLNTRWGVPRFNPDKETETYTLNGQQLWPVAHRDELEDRTANKRFYPRVEGSFNKIMRHGTTPTNYWWEVTDKNGTRTFYGGSPNSGVINDAVLKDAAGNISYWAIVESRDLNENFVRYTHDKITNPNVQIGSGGQQLYCSEIEYTGHGSSAGEYKVVFSREPGQGDFIRKDVIINCRLGFKQVTADVLRKIEVQYDGDNIRSYKLNYMEGAFYKTLLESITEFDAGGAEFTRHDFEYYDEVRNNAGNYHPLKSDNNIAVPDDMIERKLISSGITNEETSFINGSFSNGFSVGGAVTVGPPGSSTSKSNTAGINYTYSRSTVKGVINLVDINGDNLPDKVFKKKDNSLWFHPNTSMPGDEEVTYGTEVTILNANEFNKSRTKSHSFGIEAHVSRFFVGETTNLSTTTTQIYFSDFNGDGLIDIARNGKVYFNRIENGIPHFTVNSTDSPSEIHRGASVDDAVMDLDLLELEQQQLIDQAPLHDVVRMWIAPYSGSIKINALAQLIVDNSPEAQEYSSDDGVRLTIQHNDTELWRDSIMAEDTTPLTPGGINPLQVEKGDRIFFRLQSIQDGAYDQVNWDPEITYLGEPLDETDAHGKPLNRFKASDDFILANMHFDELPSPFGAIGLPEEGTITIQSSLETPKLTDDITVEIILSHKNDNPIVNGEYDHSTISSEIYIAGEPIMVNSTFAGVQVEEDDLLTFRVLSSTNVDWQAINWNPRVFYTDITRDSVPETLNGNPTIDLYPAVDYMMYNRITHKVHPWYPPVSPPATSYNLSVKPLNASAGNGSVTFSIKGPDTLYAKENISYSAGMLQNPNIILQAEVPAGQPVYFEFFTKDPVLAEALGNNSIINSGDYLLEINNTEFVNPGIYTFTVTVQRCPAITRVLATALSVNKLFNA